MGILAVALVAAALSGCGSDDESNGSADSSTTTGESSPLDGWARGLCTTVAAWQASIEATAKMANSQADFAQSSEAVTQANDVLVGGLEGLGAPPDPATSEAADALDKLAANLEESAAEIQQALSGVSTQSDIVQSTARVRTEIAQMNSDISSTVTELRSLPDEQGWKEAFQGVPACQAVAGA